MPSRSYDVTAVVVNFNGGNGLLETIKSLRAQADVRLQVFVFDDGSTDDSADQARQSGLVDRLHVSEVNTQHANRWRAAGMEAAETDLVLVTDNDIEFDVNCLAMLAKTIDEDRTIAAVTPAIYDSIDRERPHLLGSLNHFLALAVRVPDEDSRVVDSVGSGITMYSKSRLAGIGTYDTEMPMGWGSDGEFHQRIRLAGLRSVVNREAKIYHDFKPFSAKRAYRVRGATHNRLRLITTHYSLGTIIGLLPLLLAFEIFQAAFYVASGLGRAYLSGVSMFLGDLRSVRRRRSFIQGIRQRPDRELLSSGEVFIPAHVRKAKGWALRVVRLANTLLAWYWRIMVSLSRA